MAEPRVDNLPPPIAAALASQGPAVMATLDTDNRPVIVPTWFLLEDDGRILLSIDENAARGNRLEHLRHSPNLAIAILGASNWTTYVAVQGHVVEFADDDALRAIDDLAQRYTGRPWPKRDSKRVKAWVQIDSWESNEGTRITESHAD